MKSYSITRRLIMTVLLVELASALCVTAVAYLYERHDHFRSFDVLLRGRADSLLGSVQEAADGHDGLMLDGSEVDVDDDDLYEVRDDGNRVLGRSAHTPDLAASFHPEDDRPPMVDSDGDQASFGKLKVGDKSFRVIRVLGIRIIDPGHKDGGVRRNVTAYYAASTRPVWRAIQKAVSFYAYSSLIVLAVTGLLMAWLLNRGLAPLRELASGAARISATSWTFLPPEAARNTQELAPLVVALESVLQGLQHSFEQQRRFVGDAAHELKTNVAVLKSSLQLLSMKPRTSAEYQQGLERTLADCHRMEETVAQMLMLARIEETGAKLSSGASTDLVAYLRSVVIELETMSEAETIPIYLEGHGSLIAAIEPEQFQLLCVNLLINALQHSPAGSLVIVSIAERDGAAEIRFQDQGEGIDPADIPHVFERFSRSDPSRSRKTGGTGLGLAICKAIVDSVHGSIVIDSQINEGTTVAVRIPLSQPSEPRPATARI